MRQRHTFSQTTVLSLALAASLLLIPRLGAAEQITVRSGDTIGGPGTIDPNVTMLVGPTAGPFPSPFVPSDFVAAAAGPSAILTTLHPAWVVTSLSADPLAHWVNGSGSHAIGQTILYAVPFQLQVPFSSATLQLAFAEDDYLGHNPSTPGGGGIDRPGIYVNGTPLPGTNGIGDFSVEHAYAADISSVVQVGVNYLYLYCLNYHSDAGIIFSATITTTEVPNATEATTWGEVKAIYR